jgi:hypothetical protein
VARRFIRHAAEVPLEVRTVDGASRSTRALDVGHGGLSFDCSHPLPVGSTVEIRMPTVDPPFDARARVVWSRPEDDLHRVGVAFLDANDAFRARMVEQVCEIELYRRKVREEDGRSLTQAEAAEEWIRRFATRFPSGEGG